MPLKTALRTSKKVNSWARRMNASSRKMSATSRRIAAANRRQANEKLAAQRRMEAANKRLRNQELAREKKEARERAARERINRGNYCANCGAIHSRGARFCPMCGGKVAARHAMNRTIPSDVKMHVWQRDGGRCVKCGANTNLQYDHDIPFSKGGSNTVENIQLLCQACNLEKGSKIM